MADTIKMKKGDKIFDIHNSEECIATAKAEGCIFYTEPKEEKKVEVKAEEKPVHRTSKSKK